MEISTFRTMVRLMAGDTDPDEVYAYSDAAVDSAVRGVFMLGLGPEGFAASGDTITPDIESGDNYALVVYEAVRILKGGEDPVEVRTRAMTVKERGTGTARLLLDLENRIRRIRGGGSCFAGVQSFVTWALGVVAGERDAADTSEMWTVGEIQR